MGFKTAAQMHGCASPNALRNLGMLWGFIVLSTGLVYFGGNGGNGPRPRRCARVSSNDAELSGCRPVWLPLKLVLRDGGTAEAT